MAENSLEIRTKVRMAQWQSIIKECKEYGMTVAEFCEDRNISWHAYYYWLRKIREFITQPQSSETEFVQLPSPMEVAAPTNPGTITVRIGGIAVEVEDNFCWPKSKRDVISITEQQFRWLMEGLEICQPKSIKMTQPKSII